MTLKALLFDMDGTLIDSDPVHASVFVDFLAERGVTIDAADYYANIHGRQNRDIFAEMLPNEDPRAMDIAKEAAFRERVGPDFPMVAGARAFLDLANAQALKMGVVTNACGANLDTVLDALALRKYFSYQISADDVRHGKPHPAIYLNSMTALGVTASESLAFEDSPSGVASALAAGLNVIGIASSLKPNELLELGASLAIRDFNDPALTQYIAISEGATS